MDTEEKHRCTSAPQWSVSETVCSRWSPSLGRVGARLHTWSMVSLVQSTTRPSMRPPFRLSFRLPWLSMPQSRCQPGGTLASPIGASVSVSQGGAGQGSPHHHSLVLHGAPNPTRLTTEHHWIVMSYRSRLLLTLTIMSPLPTIIVRVKEDPRPMLH